MANASPFSDFSPKRRDSRPRESIKTALSERQGISVTLRMPLDAQKICFCVACARPGEKSL